MKHTNVTVVAMAESIADMAQNVMLILRFTGSGTRVRSSAFPRKRDAEKASFELRCLMTEAHHLLNRLENR